MDTGDPLDVNGPCPVCKGEAECKGLHDGATSFRQINCERCGRYSVAVQCLGTLNTIDEPHLVSGVLREMSERGESLRITPDNIHDLKSLAPTTVSDRARRLLHAM